MTSFNSTSKHCDLGQGDSSRQARIVGTGVTPALADYRLKESEMTKDRSQRHSMNHHLLVEHNTPLDRLTFVHTTRLIYIVLTSIRVHTQQENHPGGMSRRICLAKRIVRVHGGNYVTLASDQVC